MSELSWFYFMFVLVDGQFASSPLEMPSNPRLLNSDSATVSALATSLPLSDSSEAGAPRRRQCGLRDAAKYANDRIYSSI
jgi:hypothetical protein